MTISDLVAILPVVVLVGWSLLLVLVDLWVPAQRKGITALLAALGLIVSLALVVYQSGRSQVALSGMAVVDSFGSFLNVIFLASGLAAIPLAYDYLKRMKIERGEYYALLLFSITGMMLMAYAYDLIIVFLAIELLSIPLYVLAGFARPRVDSEEASLKYFLLGAFSSGFLLYGIALIFGATAHHDLVGITRTMNAGTGNPLLLMIGACLVLVGFGFKIAAVPFQQWAPDVYHGAPSPVTGFMSVAVKTAAIAALLRVFVTAFPSLAQSLTPILWALAALTMIGGNVLAIAQTNIKRLLAYSSIANAGYLLMAFVPYGNSQALANSLASSLFFLVGYGLTNFGAWAVVVAMEKAEGKGLELEDFAGLGRKYPWLALAMMVFMLSFTGIPLTLGFWGKFYLFRTAVEGGYISLALIGLVTSLISAYYYLKVVVIMYMKPGEPEAAPNRWLHWTAIVAAAAVVALAFIPEPLLQWAASALMRLQ
jgi:NADH-quinone oxidoreductase subunit N